MLHRDAEALSLDAASPRTAPRVGPMHGVHPRAKAMPRSGAPATPARGSAWIRASLLNNAKRPKTPASMRPNRMVITPNTRARRTSLSRRTRPRPPNRAPNETNTMEIPKTKPSVPSAVRRPECGGVESEVPSERSCADEPVTYDRYPGTRGSTQGDRKETRPAATATGMAISNELSRTCSPPIATSAVDKPMALRCPAPVRGRRGSHDRRSRPRQERGRPPRRSHQGGPWSERRVLRRPA